MGMTTSQQTAARQLIERLRALGLTVATAESCTGGNIAHELTLVAGCSDVVQGGVVAYQNPVKERLLGVPARTLELNGAVSGPVVTHMAAGACRALESTCAVATSGIAGPGGAVPGKPVGTVWIAARCPHKGTVARRYQFDGTRAEIIGQATLTAMLLLQSLLDN